jgi:hypothetical protein
VDPSEIQTANTRRAITPGQFRTLFPSRRTINGVVPEELHEHEHGRPSRNERDSVPNTAAVNWECKSSSGHDQWRDPQQSSNKIVHERDYRASVTTVYVVSALTARSGDVFQAVHPAHSDIEPGAALTLWCSLQ